MIVTSTWQLWAVLSAVFAALTAIFAKVGVESVNADFETIRVFIFQAQEDAGLHPTDTFTKLRYAAMISLFNTFFDFL